MHRTHNILDGKKIATQLEKELAEKIAKMPEKIGLAMILVGDDPASITYVKRKQEACDRVGILSSRLDLPADTNKNKLIAHIQAFNLDKNIHGILIQLPLPTKLSVFTAEILEAIAPNKDIDGLHPITLGKLAQKHPYLRPCTPYGIIQLLNAYHISLTGKSAVIIGDSAIVGLPMALELLLEKATVTICHRYTIDLANCVKSAEIIISATGVPNLIQSDWIKKGAIVIDAGFSRLSNGKIVGDIDPEAKHKASWITPIPGGVGPMTVVTLLQNTYLAAACLKQE